MENIEQIKDEYIPVCDKCHGCTEVINVRGISAIRLCFISRRLIHNDVKTSPLWCRKRVI